MDPYDATYEPEQQRLYVEDYGKHCPVCDSSDVSYGALDNSLVMVVTERTRCNSCEATWVNVYRLNGFTQLVNSTNDTENEDEF